MSAKRDLTAGICLLLVSLILFIETFNIEEPASVYWLASSTFYSRLCILFLAVLSIVLIFKSTSTLRKAQGGPNTGTIMIPMVSVSIALFVLYAFLMPVAGFLISTIAFLAVTTTIYEVTERGVSLTNTRTFLNHVGRQLVLAVVVSVACQQLFGKVLRVVLP